MPAAATASMALSGRLLNLWLLARVAVTCAPCAVRAAGIWSAFDAGLALPARVPFVIVFCVLAAGMVKAMTCAVVGIPAGLKIRAMFHTRLVPWGEILGADFGPSPSSDPVISIITTSGRIPLRSFPMRMSVRERKTNFDRLSMIVDTYTRNPPDSAGPGPSTS